MQRNKALVLDKETADYAAIVSVLDTYTDKMRHVIREPSYVLGYLQPGRILQFAYACLPSIMFLFLLHMVTPLFLTLQPGIRRLGEFYQEQKDQ